MVSAAQLSLAQVASDRQTRPACDKPASQPHPIARKKEFQLSLATQTTRPNASVPVRGLTLQTQQPQTLDDVARDAYIPAASLLS